MGIVDDVTTLMRKGPELASKLGSAKLNTKSVIRGANDATFQFPFLVPDTLGIDIATTLTQQADKVYASFTQTWISLHPFMDLSMDPTPISYLQRLHQNMKLEGAETISETEDTGELLQESARRAYNGEAQLYMNPEKTFGVLFEGTNRLSVVALESNKDYFREHMAEFDLSPLFTESEREITSMDLVNSLIDSKINQKENDARVDALRQSERLQAPKLTDRDVKKANDMMPYGIQVRLIAKNEKNEFVQYVDLVVGVKTIMHPVKSDDLIENIQRAFQNKNVFFKFLRWTTGEISLLKNIIFNIDDIKLDASNRSVGKSPWFGSLKRLKNKRVGLHNFTVPHALIPNATIVLTEYEANYLRDKYMIDVYDRGVGKKIISALFLVALFIVDSSSGTVDILYDGSDSYQTYSIETLERENSLRSNTLGREIGRMISHQ